MRNSILSLAACLMVAGCGGGGGTPTVDGGGNKDLTMTGGNNPDLTTTTVKTGCAGYIQCLIDCGSDTACSAQCDKNVTTAGKQKESQAIACGQNWCLGTNDMGTGDCTLNAAMTMLVDKPGAPANTCSNCLNNSLAGLFGDTCMPANDKNCNPAMCTATVTACQASTP